MSFLFPQKRPKSLNEVVYALNEWIVRVGDANANYSQGGQSGGSDFVLNEQQRQAVEESGRLLAQIRCATWAQPLDSGSQPEPDQLTALAKEVYSTDVLVPLVQNLRLLEFDSRRDVANFFSFVLKRQPTEDYLLNKIPELFTILLASAGDIEIHRTVCQILRECARHEALVAYVINLQNFWWFFQYIDDAEFEVATDNFTTFQDFLRNYPELTTQFLLRNADYFTQCINGLIRSNNYVAKRQSLRLLFQLIKQQRNQQYLLMYVKSLDNLKIIMRLLKDKSKNIHFEAFQLFKVFVANPNKPKPIVDVLVRNKSKLLDMLDKSHTLADRREDQLYQKERDYVREKILALPDIRTGDDRQAVNNAVNNGSSNLYGQQAEQHQPPQPQQQLHQQHHQQQQQQQQQLSQKQQYQQQPFQGVPNYVGNDQQTPLGNNASPDYVNARPRSPSRAKVPLAMLDPRPASPVLSRAPPAHFPHPSVS